MKHTCRKLQADPEPHAERGSSLQLLQGPDQWILNSDNFDPALYNPAQAPTIDIPDLSASRLPARAAEHPTQPITRSTASSFQGRTRPSAEPWSRSQTWTLRHASDLPGAPSPITALRFEAATASITSSRPSGETCPAAILIDLNHQCFECFLREPRRDCPSLDDAAGDWFAGRQLQVPYIESFVFDVQRQLPASIVVDVAYVGNVGRHLANTIDLNEPLPGAYVTAGIAPAGGLTTSNSVKLNQIGLTVAMAPSARRCRSSPRITTGSRCSSNSILARR